MIAGLLLWAYMPFTEVFIFVPVCFQTFQCVRSSDSGETLTRDTTQAGKRTRASPSAARPAQNPGSWLGLRAGTECDKISVAKEMNTSTLSVCESCLVLEDILEISEVDRIRPKGNRSEGIRLSRSGQDDLAGGNQAKAIRPRGSSLRGSGCGVQA